MHFDIVMAMKSCVLSLLWYRMVW